MATQLTDEEKKELSDAYVNSAYFLAVPMMKGKNTDYGKARALLEEVLPYASEPSFPLVEASARETLRKSHCSATR